MRHDQKIGIIRKVFLICKQGNSYSTNREIGKNVFCFFCAGELNTILELLNHSYYLAAKVS